MENAKSGDNNGQAVETSKESSSNKQKGSNLKIHYIDVGQADSILIQQGSQNMLIDAGNNDDSDLVISYLRKQGIKKLDYIIGTHPHEDHIGGMDYVINNLEIGKVFMPKKTADTRTYKDVIKAIKAKNLKITVPKPGNSYDLGEAEWTILAPEFGKEYKDTNNYSIVLRMTFGSKSFLFTGDAEDIAEEEILMKGYTVKSDVLKAGHHGSHSSTTNAFLKAVSPEYAVISCGKDNDYGHPHRETRDKLNGMGIKTFRTDECGTIVCTSDGTSIIFNCESNSNSYTDDKNKLSDNKEEKSVKKTVIIRNVDLSKEICSIENISDVNVDMTGWKLVSVNGNQSYNFPKGYILKAGKSVNINSGKKAKEDGKSDLIWTNSNIWNNSGDPAELYNGKGELVSSK
jgi:competence protein ComEC